MKELHAESAIHLQAAVAAGELSCTEVVQAHCDRIAAVNPAVNALCTFEPEQALQAAHDADARLAAGEPPRALEGLPIAIKDLAETRGMRTTLGSPLFADNVPDVDQLFVARVKAAGAIVVGKTNTPEFGAGSQTFNTLFGATCNPWDLSCTAGGSSGGAAAALAARMLPIADGSDLGGSLRNPAAFCNVVGFRPTPGRVPRFPVRQIWDPLAVMGPMARSVDDLALLLSVMAGPDPRDPMSRAEPGTQFAPPLAKRAATLEQPAAPPRIAASADLGFLPVEPAVRDVFAQGSAVFEQLGALTFAHPDLSDGPEIFQTLRAHGFATRYGALLQSHRAQLKDTVIWNIERGLGLSVQDLSRAELAQSVLIRRMQDFFEVHDFLILPTTQVQPFDVTQDWVREIDGVPMQTYLDWMEICSVITLSGCPALSIPCGFTPQGRPVGLQIVGPAGADRRVLALARAFEAETRWAERVPDCQG